jgi:hypothetical protein
MFDTVKPIVDSVEPTVDSVETAIDTIEPFAVALVRRPRFAEARYGFLDPGAVEVGVPHRLVEFPNKCCV